MTLAGDLGAARALGGANSQAAARLLLLLDRLGTGPTGVELQGFPEAVRVVRSTSRLAKLDFWLRNPDYLANEMLNDVESGALDPGAAFPHIERMLSGSAPVLHLYPMQRYMYGAWELPDNAMALLKSHRLVAQRRVGLPEAENWSRARRDYFLLAKGAGALTNLRKSVPQLAWYDLQADAIGLLNLGPSGAAAKARQYAQPEYAQTPIGEVIGPILERARTRFAALVDQYGHSAATKPAAAVVENDRSLR